MFNKQTVVCAALPKTLQQYLLISVSLSLCHPLATPLSLSLTLSLSLHPARSLPRSRSLSLISYSAFVVFTAAYCRAKVVTSVVAREGEGCRGNVPF